MTEKIIEDVHHKLADTEPKLVRMFLCAPVYAHAFVVDRSESPSQITSHNIILIIGS